MAAENGKGVAAAGFTVTPGPLWLVEPVMGEPDPQTGAQTVVTPGQKSPNVVLLSRKSFAGLSHFKINPVGHAGFA